MSQVAAHQGGWLLAGLYVSECYKHINLLSVCCTKRSQGAVAPAVAPLLFKPQDYPAVVLALLLDFLAEHPADFLGVGDVGTAARLDIDTADLDDPD